MKYGREILRDAKPYIPGEQPAGDVIKLNTNENPYPPSPKVMEAIASTAAGAVRKYPDPLSVALRSACAEQFNLPGPEWVIAGNGMDEILAMAIRTFSDPGDRIISTYPTYVLYETLAQLHGARFEFVDLDEKFELPDRIYDDPARIMFIPRPNAPSGVAHHRADLERLCESAKGIVVIDEAYADFAADNCTDFPQRYDNVIVSRTFSKAYSLAGLRLGIGMAQPDIINEFLKTKDSYNLNAVTQAAGLAAVQDDDTMRANASRVVETRTRMTAALREMGFDVPDSQANFVLACWHGNPDARTIFEKLKSEQIFVRYFNQRRLDDALRISVGTDEEVNALIGAIRAIIA